LTDVVAASLVSAQQVLSLCNMPKPKIDGAEKAKEGMSTSETLPGK